jgi:dTDP-4-amino-4,6-dideoxygalactose transaminase
VLSLPMFPELTEAQLDYVANSLAAAFEGQGI